ncbi:MAG: hypothetical protein IPN15_06620 [Saprospiraceae bacterium]|nr:hypothetical protein [Candidatus Vicinibacter affinis]
MVHRRYHKSHSCSTEQLFLTVTDANNCSASSSFHVDQAPPLSYVITSYDPFAARSWEASSSKVSSGGIPPFQYALNGMTNLSGIFSSLPPGSYIATFSDALGCTRSDTVLILPPPLFEVDMTDSLSSMQGLPSWCNTDSSKAPFKTSCSSPVKESLWIRVGCASPQPLTKFIPSPSSTTTAVRLPKRSKSLSDKTMNSFAPLIFSPNNDRINDFWLPSWGSSWTRA